MHAAAESVWLAVAPLLPGFTVETVDEIDSTNTELMRRARAGRHEPVLLVARRQTAGRGRLGRQWATGDPQSALTFSLGLSLRPADWSGLSLAVGVCLAEALHPDIRLKWPNDLWLGDRKLAGILVETAGMGAAGQQERYAVIGIGINLEPPPGDGFRTPPAALREVLPDSDAGAVLQRVVPPLVAELLAFGESGFAPVQARFAARDALAGRELLLSDGTGGRAAGVGADGALLVHTASGVQRVSSSEVSVRPLSP